MPRADGSGSMAPMSEASVAFHCSPGNRGCALSLHLFWQRSSFSESTEQVSTGLGGVWKWGSGGDGDACGHLECGLRRKPGVSKVQVEPLRRGWGCRPSAAVPMTSSLCPGDLWAGAQPRRHPAVLWSPAPLRLLAEVWRTCRPRPDQPAHPRRRHRLSSQEVMEAALGQLRRRKHGPRVLPNPSSRECSRAPGISVLRGLRPRVAGRGGRAEVHPGASGP